MIYAEAPYEAFPHFYSCPSVFMAGGITGCINWQEAVVEALKDENVYLLNPRRKNFPMGDPVAGKKQIEWEHKFLNEADAILFWFPKETLCPITLFELGAHLKDNKPIFIGTHPEYGRKDDVRIQTGLVRPGLHIVHSLEDLVACVKTWLDRDRWCREGILRSDGSDERGAGHHNASESDNGVCAQSTCCVCEVVQRYVDSVQEPFGPDLSFREGRGD